MRRFVKTAVFALISAVVFFHPGFSQTNITDVHYRINTFTAKDSAKLSYKKWYRKDAAAVIIYLSGLQSHSQWFADTGDRLFEKCYSVYALDRRGSGLSSGDRGDILSYETWIDDLDQFVVYVREQNPGIPVHLMANCFGSRITLGFSLLHPDAVDSLIIITPGIYMNVDVSFMDKVRILRQTTDRIPVPIKPEMFTSDPGKLSFIKNDILMLNDVSARLQMQGAILNDRIKDSTQLFRTPMLVMMSADDEIINTEKTRKNFFKPLRCKKKLVEYRGVRHFLMFEKSKDAVTDEIISWTDNF